MTMAVDTIAQRLAISRVHLDPEALVRVLDGVVVEYRVPTAWERMQLLAEGWWTLWQYLDEYPYLRLHIRTW